MNAEKELGLLEKAIGLIGEKDLNEKQRKTVNDLRQSIPMGKTLTPEEAAEIRGITTSILANTVEDAVHGKRKDLGRVLKAWKGIKDASVRLDAHAKLGLPAIRKILENPEEFSALNDEAFNEMLPFKLTHEMAKYARKEGPDREDLKTVWFNHLSPEQRKEIARRLENDLETFAKALTYSESLDEDKILPDKNRFLDLMEEQVNRRLTDGNPLESTGRALKSIYGTPLWDNLIGRIMENPKAVNAVKEMLREHEMRAKLGNG